MRRIILFTFILFASSLCVFSRPVYIYHKENGTLSFNFKYGFYTGYNRVVQTISFTQDATGKPVELITVKCTDPGHEYCKGQNTASQIIINDYSFDPKLIGNIVENILLDIDNKVFEEKILEGTQSNKYRIRSNENIDCVIFFNIS